MTFQPHEWFINLASGDLTPLESTEVDFVNSEELSLIKSSPLPAQLHAPAGEELTPLDS